MEQLFLGHSRDRRTAQRDKIACNKTTSKRTIGSIRVTISCKTERRVSTKKNPLARTTLKIENHPDGSIPMVLLRDLHELSESAYNISQLRTSESKINELFDQPMISIRRSKGKTHSFSEMVIQLHRSRGRLCTRESDLRDNL